MVKKEFEGDLKWISPSKIIKENENDKVGSFFVGLGVIFNDLKDLVLFEQSIVSDYRKPKARECSDHVGNYAGIMVHINRMIASTIHEFFIFIEKNGDVLNDTEFKDILENVSSEDKEMWDGIVAAAHGKLLRVSEFLKTLVRIRNNFTYHYCQSGKVLRKGFKSRFDNEQIDSRNEKAFYSIGANMEQTRFYFADAAVEEALFLEAGKGEKKKIADDVSIKKYQLQMQATIEIMRRTIMSLLKKFLQSRRNRPQ